MKILLKYFLTLLVLIVVHSHGFAQTPTFSGTWILNFEKSKLEQIGESLQATMWRKNYLNIVNYKFGKSQNEFVADEVFTGRPKNHHSIWVFDREVSKSNYSLVPRTSSDS